MKLSLTCLLLALLAWIRGATFYVQHTDFTRSLPSLFSSTLSSPAHCLFNFGVCQLESHVEEEMDTYWELWQDKVDNLLDKISLAQVRPPPPLGQWKDTRVLFAVDHLECVGLLVVAWPCLLQAYLPNSAFAGRAGQHSRYRPACIVCIH